MAPPLAEAHGLAPCGGNSIGAPPHWGSMTAEASAGTVLEANDGLTCGSHGGKFRDGKPTDAFFIVRRAISANNRRRMVAHPVVAA